MKLARFIAWRYFNGRTKKNFVHHLSFFSIGMVAVGTMALIIGLSAFNGMESLLRAHYASFDPALSLQPKEGYTFVFAKKWATYLDNHPAIASYSPVVEDYALISHKGRQTVIKLRGIAPAFFSGSALRTQLRRGSFTLQVAGEPRAFVGEGVQYMLGMHFYEEGTRIRLFYPTTAVGFNPKTLYYNRKITVAGTFSLHQLQDKEYVLVPLTFARQLMGDNHRCTSVSIRLHKQVAVNQVAAQIRSALGDELQVLTREQQHASLYRLLRIEKFFVFLSFAFILAIASFGLFFVLLMLFLAKKQDLSLFVALGARPKLLRSIFIWEGLLISGIGGSIGVILGLLACYGQQYYGVATLNMQHGTIAYPIEVHFRDLVISLGCVTGLTLLAVLRPAWLAGRHGEKIIRT